MAKGLFEPLAPAASIVGACRHCVQSQYAPFKQESTSVEQLRDVARHGRSGGGRGYDDSWHRSAWQPWFSAEDRPVKPRLAQSTGAVRTGGVRPGQFERAGRSITGHLGRRPE